MSDHDEKVSAAFYHVMMIIASLVLTRLLFLMLMPTRAVSEDMHHWLAVDQLLSKGENPYNASTFLNWPPLWMQIIRGLSFLGNLLHVHLDRMIQLFLIVIEAGIATVSWSFARLWLGKKQATVLVMIVIVCNPINVLLICQHCNFDCMVALWVLLACYFHVRFLRGSDETDWLATCLFLGLGVLTKTTPLILFPILFHQIKAVRWGTRLMGAFLVVFPAFLGISILFVLGPEHIMQKVLSYRSHSGYFGFTGLLNLLSLQDLFGVYRKLFLVAMLAVIFGVSLRLAKTKSTEPHRSVLLVALLMMMAPVFGPGYAPQYAYWYMPLLGLSFIFFDRWWKVVLITLATIGSLTYLVEYGLFISHGAYLVHITQSEELFSLSMKLSTAKAQTLIRLPLFLAYLLVFVKGWKLVRVDREGEA